jgi:hypothetical protein
MKIEDKWDIQLLVEDFNWHREYTAAEIVNMLKELNAKSHKEISHLINQRVWDETFDDEMAVAARFDAAQRWTKFDKAIEQWYEWKQ